MDFVITDDGELIKYNGSSGEVVIPEGVRFIAREGVFDPSVKITALHLPKSLLGHKCDDDGAYGEVFIYPKESNGREGYILEKDDWLYTLDPKDVLFYPLTLDLPYLERYTVEPGNVAYAAPMGVLVFLAIRCVIDVPKCSDVPMSLETSYAKYSRRLTAIKDRTFLMQKAPAVRIKIDGDLLEADEYMDILKLANHGIYIFEALEARHLIFGKDPNYWKYDIKTIVIGPYIDMTYVNAEEARRIAFGYCYDSKLYGEEQSIICQNILESNESFFYRMAKDHRLKPIVNYFKNSWSNKVIHSKGIVTEPRASRYLMDAVIFGSLGDVKKALELDFTFVGRERQDQDINVDGGEVILALACRYGGLEKLKCLLLSPKFTKPAGDGELSILSKFFAHNMLLDHDGTFVRGFSKYCTLAFTSNYDACNLSPISNEERFECFKLLLKCVSLPARYKQTLYFRAMMSGELDDKAIAVDNMDIAQFALSQRSHDERDAYYAVIKQALKDHPQGVVTLAKMLKDKGSPLAITDRYDLSSLTDKPEIVTELFSVAKVDTAMLHDFIEQVAKENRVDTLLAVLRSRSRLTKPMIEKFIELCDEANNSECVAAILNYQAANKSKSKSNKGKAKSSLSL